MANLAPIALFVYNRPYHISRTIDLLRKNLYSNKTDLLIFSDGPKNEDSIQSVSQVRRYLTEVEGFKSIDIIESKFNKGLSNSIIEGIETTLKKYNNVIVLEDDLETSPYFIQYMNEALEMYANDSEVISIHGYCYPTKSDLPESFFIKGADCWGWATWKDSWKLFDKNGKRLLTEIKNRNLVREFDFDKKAGYTQMLIDQIKGKNDSWAVRWYASAFLNDKLTLYPGKSLVQNIGHDSLGTHGSATDVFHTQLNNNFKSLGRIAVEENKIARAEFERFFLRIRKKKNIFSRILNKIRNLRI